LAALVDPAVRAAFDETGAVQTTYDAA